MLNFPESLADPDFYSSQLRKLVEAGVSQDELRQILAQLRNMVKSSAPPPVPQPTLLPAHSWHLNHCFPHIRLFCRHASNN